MRRSVVASVAFWIVLAVPAYGLDDARWLHPDADRLSILTRVPSECLEQANTVEQAYILALGRLAFRAPSLLGGLAARTGMRCQTCHRNGHDNPYFYLEGFSDKPGTADVTSNVFSHTRGDGVFNPIVIPTLLDAYTKHAYGSVVPFARLEDFITEAIITEFQGRIPSRPIVDGLVSYVSALRSDACPATDWFEVSFEADLAEVTETYRVLIESITRDDLETATFVLVALRAVLGRVAQRFAATSTPFDELVGLSFLLKEARDLFGTDKNSAIRALTAWRAQLDRLLPRLRRFTGSSLYDEGRLKDYLRTGRR